MAPKSEKILEQYLPEGQLVNLTWLHARGFRRPRVDYGNQGRANYLKICIKNSKNCRFWVVSITIWA